MRKDIMWTHDLAQQTIGRSPSLLRICELGNQRLRPGISKHHTTAKSYFLSLGYQHMSIDLNGKDGAVRWDLTKCVPESWRHVFDIVSNHGTTEHVADQAAVFENIHQLCVPGGVMIHVLPLAGTWGVHGLYEYTSEFIPLLAEEAGYEILKCVEQVRESDLPPATDRPRTSICAVLRKPCSDEPDYSRIAFAIDKIVEAPSEGLDSAQVRRKWQGQVPGAVGSFPRRHGRQVPTEA
jgi:SAM-dependent methyltransferase